MTLEQILARARALMTEEVEVDEPLAAAAGQHRVLPCVPVGPPSIPDKQNTVAVQFYVWRSQSLCQRLSAANHKERFQRYAVISANKKDMSHQGVQKTRQGARGWHYSLPT